MGYDGKGQVRFKTAHQLTHPRQHIPTLHSYLL
jgi:phosphoribosylaminoimidazole carboxylase (NCAIR synthetase)